jgi:NAD-dependent dihydropyrimidine dehydrogenase PreA subunit
MIELVSPERCTGCNICVEVCPTRVFDLVPRAQPVIARQHDCQTCFMCELYCPADALYVAPLADAAAGAAEPALAERGLLGSYRRAVGWQAGQDSTAALDASHELLARAR